MASMTADLEDSVSIVLRQRECPSLTLAQPSSLHQQPWLVVIAVAPWVGLPLERQGSQARLEKVP